MPTAHRTFRHHHTFSPSLISMFYNFPSIEAHERILYDNFLKVNQDVKDMIAEIQEFYKK